jgi:hypothetical protein
VDDPGRTGPPTGGAAARAGTLPAAFIIAYLAGGGTLGRLQQLLRHEDIAATARYLAAVDEQRAPVPKDPWAR